MREKRVLPQREFVERRRYPRVVLNPLGTNTAEKGALRPVRFATAGLPATQQFAAWQAHNDTMMDSVLPDGVGPEAGFIVQQAVWNLDGILLVQQEAPAYSFFRSAEKVRLSPIDHWRINFLSTGRSWTDVDGLIAENQPGMMEVRSLGYPFRGRETASRSLSLIVPVDMFADRGGLPRSSNNTVLGGHRCQNLLDYLSSVEANLDRFTLNDLPVVRDHLNDMVFDAVAPLVDRDEEKTRESELGLMARARRFILENISSSDLSADALCKALAISRTRLYELFENSGGVAHYIRRRQLLAAHAMLANPSDTRKISEVAYAIGFDSAANFSRAFMHQFGYSPSNVRKHVAGHGLTSRSTDHDHPGANLTFDHLLRTLGT